MPSKFVPKKGKCSPKEYIKSPENKYLIIVESPSKCAKIESFLGNEYKCIASIGHLREIKGLKSIETTNNYNIKFSISESKKEHIKSMEKIIKQFDTNNIILATDDDREGEAIAWHICDIFELNIDSTQRIVFHEVTQEALLRSLSSKRNIDMNIVQAQWARQVLDMLIGFNISPMLWKYMYYDKDNSLSAGRCQTPALRLVYDNEQEKINGNGVEKTYKMIGNFTERHLEFVLSKEFSKKEEIIEFLTKSINFHHILSIGSPKISTSSPPKPFNTSSLLQTASNILHISPKETMKYCQVLYQGGHITYMRTENRKYSTEFLNEIKQFIENKWCSKYVGNTSNLENNSKSNPHEAIRVTHLNIRELPEKEYVGKIASLYQLIWKNTVQSCMSDAKYQNTDVFINSPLDNERYKHTIEIPVFLGWKNCDTKIIAPEKSLENEQSCGNGLCLYLQTLSKTDAITYNRIDTQTTFHNQHVHYTESSLIKKLEDFGIGRPSTFSIFIETIIDRGYVKKTDIEGVKMLCEEYFVEGTNTEILSRNINKTIGNEKGKLVIQSTGTMVIEFLIKHFDKIFEYNYTIELEEKLDNICENGEQWYKLCNDCDILLKEFIIPLNKLSKTIFPLDKNHGVTFTKYGATIQKKDDSGLITFMNVKKNIRLDLDSLKRGEYTLKDLEETNMRCLGDWEGSPIFIKNGQYGIYLEWGEQKKTCKDYKKTLEEFTLEDVEIIMNTNENTTHMNILRIFNSEISIRRGKFGPYAFYQNTSMKKPKFFNIKQFKEGFLTCESETFIQWIEDKYLKCK